MCWCSSGREGEVAAIASQKERVERLAPSIEQAKAEVKTLTEQITELEEELAEHEQAKAQAEAIRSKETSQYSADRDVLKQSIEGLEKALVILNRAKDANSFLQASTSVKSALVPFSQIPSVRTALEDRDMQRLLTQSESFLQTGAQFAPDHIIGVLQGLLMGFQADLSGSAERESTAVEAYDSLMSSKGSELLAATQGLRKLTEEKSGLSAQLARDNDDIAATQVSYAQDMIAFKEKEQECETRTGEFHARQEARLEEQLAINEAVQVLSADDVHVVLSKSTEPRQPMPMAISFLQVRSTDKSPNDVLKYVQTLASANPANKNLALVALKLSQMSGQGFERVIQVINKQIEIMDMEQAQDDTKKHWCDGEFSGNKQGQDIKEGELADFKAQVGMIDADLVQLRQELTDLAGEMDAMRREEENAAANRADEATSFDEMMSELKTE